MSSEEALDRREARTWTERMGSHLADTVSAGERAGAEYFTDLLEAAGELKAVRLKVLLGRCYELIAKSKVDNETVSPDHGFLDEILAELK